MIQNDTNFHANMYHRENKSSLVICSLGFFHWRIKMAKRLPTLALDDSKHIICSVEIAAVQLGLSRVGLEKSIKELNIPKENARVDLSEVIRIRSEADGEEEEPDKARKLKAEADYKMQKAKQEEMVTLQMMGELIPQEEVKDALENEFLDIRQKLLLLPDTIKSKVYAIDPVIASSCGEVVNEAVQECLKGLARINDSPGDKEPVAKKPKRNYKKGAKRISAATTGDGK